MMSAVLTIPQEARLRELRQRALQASAWEEAKHPRDDDGKFAETEGGGDGPTKAQAAIKQLEGMKGTAANVGNVGKFLAWSTGDHFTKAFPAAAEKFGIDLGSREARSALMTIATSPKAEGGAGLMLGNDGVFKYAPRPAPDEKKEEESDAGSKTDKAPADDPRRPRSIMAPLEKLMGEYVGNFRPNPQGLGNLIDKTLREYTRAHGPLPVNVYATELQDSLRDYAKRPKEDGGLGIGHWMEGKSPPPFPSRGRGTGYGGRGGGRGTSGGGGSGSGMATSRQVSYANDLIAKLRRAHLGSSSRSGGQVADDLEARMDRASTGRAGEYQGEHRKDEGLDEADEDFQSEEH